MKTPKDQLTDDLFEPDPIVDRVNDEIIDTPHISFWKDAWIRLSRNKGALISIFLLSVITMLAIIDPYMNEHTYKDQNLAHSNLPPKVTGLEWLGFHEKDNADVDQY